MDIYKFFNYTENTKSTTTVYYDKTTVKSHKSLSGKNWSYKVMNN